MHTGIVLNCRHLNIRESASSDSTILGTVDVFDKIFVDLEASNDEFYKVATPSGIEGYCDKAYVGKLENENGECVHEDMGGGGVSSWNDLTDKPFYKETVVEWETEETLTVNSSTNINIDYGHRYRGSYDGAPFEFGPVDKGEYIYFGKDEYDSGVSDFYIRRHVTGDPCTVECRDDGEDHTLVYQPGISTEVIHKISGQFLPDSLMTINNTKPTGEQVVVSSPMYGPSGVFYYNGNESPIHALYMKSESGKVFRIIISDEGTITATEV